jgi:hypothetical protein
MSLNHLMYPYVPDVERLNISVCDVYCCNVFSENPITNFNIDNIEQRVYEQLSDNVVVLGTEGEKSIFNTTGAIGSNNIPANTVRVGSKYKIYSHGEIETNGSNQSFILNTKLGTSIIETKTITLPNLNNGSFYELNGDILLYQIGDAGTAVAKSFFNFNFTDQQGLSENYFIDETNNTTFQTTSDANADITINWNNQNVANIFKCHSLSFSKIY